MRASDFLDEEQPAPPQVARRASAFLDAGRASLPSMWGEMPPEEPWQTPEITDAADNLLEPPGAAWGDVLRSVVPGAGAQIRSAIANLRRMSNQESIEQSRMVLEPQAMPGGASLPHMVRRGIERQQARLEKNLAARPEIEADASAAMQDLATATPKDMSTGQQAVFSAGSSAPTTLAGLAAGIATRSPAVGMAIAGGGGSTIQAGSTYGEAREKGASHRMASLAAAGDAAIEGLDALPVGVALKRGSVFAKRVLKTAVAESLTEGGQQLLQDLRSMAMENPELTLGELWENSKVAMLAGTIGGTVYGSIGGAAHAGRKEPAPMHSEDSGAPAAPVGEPQPVQPVAPAGAAPVATTAAPRPADAANAGAGQIAIPDDVKDTLRVMAANAGHLERGGQVIRKPSDTQTGGDVVGVTTWVGQPAWAKGLGATPAEVQTAVEKAIAGKPLGAKQRDIVKAMLAEVAATRQNLGPAASDRRTDAASRARVAEMTPEQMRRELLTSRFGGIGNRRAYEESARKRVQVAIDADSLKWINDNLGHAAGDELLRAIGESLATVAPQDSFHVSGDEFVLQTDNNASADLVLTALADEIAQREITYEAPDGRIFTYVPRISHGQGPTLREADTALARAKTERESTGARAGRGERPVGLDEATPIGWEAQNRPAEEIGDRGRADRASGRPALAATGIAMNPPYVPGAPASVAAAIDANRARPDAIRQAVRDLFKVPINEGGFKKSRDALGIYKVQPRTIRVRNQNDIGVIAHETGHHFSETSRAVRQLMKTHEKEIGSITPYASSQKTAALKREEGFAEYLRLRWTDKTNAIIKAPKFGEAFERYIDENGYRPAFNAIEGAIRDWQNLPPTERILAKVGEAKPPFRKRWNVDSIVFEVFDRWLPMKRMVEDLKPSVAPSADPFKLAHLLAGDAAMIEDWLLRETTPFNFERRANPKDRGKPLSEILKPVEAEQRQFGTYLIAKRASELTVRGKEHLYSPDEIRAGLSLETPAFKAAAEGLYRYQDQLLDYPVEGGLLSSRAADAFRRFPFYVPFFRVGEKIGGGRSGNIFKEIRGGTENLRDPIASIIENTVRVIHATNRNAVLAKAHDLARSVPGGGRWLEDVPIPERAVKVETQKVIEALRKEGVEIPPEAAEALATSQTFFVKNPFGDESNRIIIVRRAGKPHALQVNNEMLWRALERFEPVDMGWVESLLSIPADLLRAGVVLSPEYMSRNFARDTLSGFIQSKAGILPVAGTVSGFKEIASRSDAARLYRAFGGAYGDMWRADRGLERKLVERMARHGGFDPRTIVTPRGLISLLHRLGSFTEAGTRVAEFKKSMGKGTVDELIDAAYNAREVSSDFGMHGHSRSVRFMTRIVPFLNATGQGIYKSIRTGGTAPLATIARGSMLTAASLWLYFENRDEEWYRELPQWERNTYWHIDVGIRDPIGQVIALRVPKPWEWGAVFGSVPEAMAEVAIEQNGEDFGKRLASIVDDVMLPRAFPTALLVPHELAANRNQFTGAPIVPQSKERLAPELQAHAGTSETAKKLGALTGTAPAKIDHAVRGFTGTLGTYVLMLTDQAMRLDGKVRAHRDFPWQRAPVVRVFFRDPSGASSKQVTEFYELLREARRADASLRQMGESGAAEYFSRHQASIEQRRGAEKVARQMANLRREVDELREDQGLPAEERQRMILENNRQIRWLARDFMRDARPATVPAPR